MYKNITDFREKHVMYSWNTKYPVISHYVGVNTLIKNKNEVVVYMGYKSITEKQTKYIKTQYDKQKYDYIKNKALEHI